MSRHDAASTLSCRPAMATVDSSVRHAVSGEAGVTMTSALSSKAAISGHDQPAHLFGPQVVGSGHEPAHLHEVADIRREARHMTLREAASW